MDEFGSEHKAPFRRWQEQQRRDAGDPPSPELGRNLETFDDVLIWLSHPSNWFAGVMDIIKWNGSVPTISSSHAWELAPGSWGRDMMLRVVLTEHQRRKRGGHKEVQREPVEEVPDV